MAHLRFNLDLAIPMPLPPDFEAALPIIKAKILQMKGYAERINEGQENEEATTRAVQHVCRHQDGEACDEEQDI